MKKRIISVLLVMTMVLSTSQIIFADSVETQGSTTSVSENISKNDNLISSSDTKSSSSNLDANKVQKSSS